MLPMSYYDFWHSLQSRLWDWLYHKNKKRRAANWPPFFVGADPGKRSGRRGLESIFFAPLGLVEVGQAGQKGGEVF